MKHRFAVGCCALLLLMGAAGSSAEESGIRIPHVGLDFVYHNETELFAFLSKINQAYPHLTELYSIGRSVLGSELWVLAISAQCTVRVALRPEVKYVGNIHGNEPVGREVLLHFIRYLVTSYGVVDEVTSLLNKIRIHILPSLNPDGFASSTPGCRGTDGRNNAYDYDLNRAFPDLLQSSRSHKQQPEAAAVIGWIRNTSFVLSAGFHGGALVASYPYNSLGKIPIHVKNGEQATPDDDVFRHLAAIYATNHRTMWKGEPCNTTSIPTQFAGGVTNAAAWYSASGTMDDYNYVARGIMEISIEISCCKYPPAERLEQFWLENKEALTAFAFQATRGVKGVIVDINGTALPDIPLKILGRDNIFYTNSYGEFWRILLPGSYILHVMAPGWNRDVSFKVDNDTATLLNVIAADSVTAETEVPTEFPTATMELDANGTTTSSSIGETSTSLSQPVISFVRSDAYQFKPLCFIIFVVVKCII